MADMLNESMDLTPTMQEEVQPIRQPITKETIKTAYDTLQKYRSGKENLDKKIIENEDWYKMRHQRYYKDADKPGEKPYSAWLWNLIMNKHADLMDNFPEPLISPQERNDEQAAKAIQSIIPVLLDKCSYKKSYSAAGWDLLKNGSNCFGVFWNPKLERGLGQVDIRVIDMLNLYWEPGIEDIQDSKAIFLLSLMDNDTLTQIYPQLDGKLTGNALDQKQYHYDDSVDTSDKSVVVDWYYKVNRGGGDILHYVKFCGDEILFASENEPAFQEEGFYRHGKYPFIVTQLFPVKGTPAGVGYIDTHKNVQEYIDKIGGTILDNALWSAVPRYFGKDSASINEEEFLDVTKKIVHVAGSVNDDNVKQINTTPLPSIYLSIYNEKINEIKETSGNTDFSQGNTSGGVTAASSIAALQEASSKGSRDMLQSVYDGFKDICNLVIELMRQFYTEPRTFRIIGETGQEEFIDFNNALLQGRTMNDFGLDLSSKEPAFDVKVRIQKSSAYSRLSQNEMAIQFYNLGFFNPQNSDMALATIGMMDFDGKQKVEDAIRKNGQMYEQIQKMQQQMTMMADVIARSTGDQRLLQAMGGQQPAPEMPSGEHDVKMIVPDQLGSAEENENSTAAKARRRTREATEVK